MMKPATGGEAMSKHSPDLPGWLGTARRDRSVEEPGRPGKAWVQSDPQRPEGINNQGTGPGRESERLVVRAEQRVDREGSSPSGARMRSAVSKSGGNSSLAGKSGRYAFTYASVERPKRARRRKPETDQGGPGA